MSIKGIYRSKFFRLSLLLFVIIIFFSFMFFKYFIPNIELLGDNSVKVLVGSSYEEIGYKAYTDYLDLTDKVVISGNVDTKKLGKYKLSYEINSLFFSDKVEREVLVIDEEAPVIELNGDNDVYLCPNSTYQEDGYRVSDNYDSDLSSNVIVETIDNVIYYKVTDSSGNEAVSKRNIYYEDKEVPKLELNGSSTIYVYRGEKYKELGYSASDNCLDDITNRVSVSNNVNVNRLGTYKVNYSVSDDSGNKIDISRVVKVIDRPVNKSGTIYLTFDDGPSQTITAKVLDILKEEGVLATFFVINRSDSLNYLIKREYNEGHTVALHAYNHNYASIYTSMNSYFADLEKIQNKIKGITGEKSMIIRFPGGSSNTISRNYKKGIMSELTTEVVARGYHYFDWNVSSGDAGGVSSSEQVYQNVTSRLSPNRANVVLMHDFENNYYTLNALRNIIRFAKDNGYRFERITMDTAMVTHGVAN